MTSVCSLCTDTSEAIELFLPQNLFLKPIARLNVSVQLPQLKSPGKSISNWEVMEKIKHMCRPYQFTSFKVIKSTLEFIRFEGETENKQIVKTLTQRLEGKTIKLSGFPDILKVRSGEAKITFPTRHNWDSYFRDAKHMNEMKPGERPDTIHLIDLPTKWFADRKSDDKDKPNEFVLKKIFESCGHIRCIDIPMLDPYRKEMFSTRLKKGGAWTTPLNNQTFAFGGDLMFEAYIQFSEYIGFVKAMTMLKGMRLLYKAEDDKAYTANIKVEFDKSKHLSDKNIKKRRTEREKLEELENIREEKVRKEREVEEQKNEEERMKKFEEDRQREMKRSEKVRIREERRIERGEKRKIVRLEKKRKLEEKKMTLKIAVEERRILIAQRKLESYRLLSELFNKIKVIKQHEELIQQEKDIEEKQKQATEEERIAKIEHEQKKIEAARKKQERLERQEKELREKILKNLKTMEERKAEREREELRQKVAGTKRLKSTIVLKR